MNIRFFIGVPCAALAIATAMPAAAQEDETVTPYFNQAIPNIPGKSLVAQFVDYAPGGASAPHAHSKIGFRFRVVLSGEIESQVNDEPKRVHRAGESWYEAPGSIHRVSRNASTTAIGVPKLNSSPGAADAMAVVLHPNSLRNHDRAAAILSDSVAASG